MGKRGILVAIEGVDGAGKTSQAEHLRARLAELGEVATVLREPGGTALGERLRDILLAKSSPDPVLEALLFSASRRQLVEEAVRPRIERGEHVVLDRSFLSTWVYQGLAGGVALEVLEELTRLVHGDAWPDRILLLDLDIGEARARRDGRGDEADGFEARGDDFLTEVVHGFRWLAARDPELIRVVPSAASEAEVAQCCWTAVADLWEGR